MAVELRQLRYFQMLARELSFSRAASRLNISQSSVSEQIQRLEDVIGVALVDRRGRRIHLTPAGVLLSEEVNAIISGVGQTVERVRALGGQTQLTLNVGYSEMAIGTPMPAILQALRECHPSLQIKLREQSSIGADHTLLTGTLDVVFVPALNATPGTDRVELGSQAVLLALPKASPLATAPSVTIADLQDQTIILPDEASALTRYVMAAFALAGLMPPNIVRANRSLSMLTLVASKQGVAFLPESLRGLVPPELTTRSLDGDELAVPFAMLWAKTAANPAIDMAVAIARRWCPVPEDQSLHDAVPAT